LDAVVTSSGRKSPLLTFDSPSSPRFSFLFEFTEFAALTGFLRVRVTGTPRASKTRKPMRERGHLKRAHEARGVLYCAYEAHGAGKTVLRGSQTTEAKLPAVGACARSRHAGIYARRTQWHFSTSRDVTVSLCKLVDSWSRRSGRISGLPMSQCGLVAVPILHMKRTPTLS